MQSECKHGESVHLYLRSECKQDESVIHSWGRILRFAQNDNLGLLGQLEIVGFKVNFGETCLPDCLPVMETLRLVLANGM